MWWIKRTLFKTDLVFSDIKFYIRELTLTSTYPSRPVEDTRILLLD